MNKKSILFYCFLIYLISYSSVWAEADYSFKITNSEINRYDLAVSYQAGISQLQSITASSSLLRVNYARQLAVKEAWAQERELVRTTGQGTHPWTEAEKQELLSTGKVKGYEGHHINSVSSNGVLAGDPDNIKFVNGRGDHLLEHGGSFKNQTSGPLVKRKKYLETFRWSTSKTNLIAGGFLVVTGGILLWNNIPDIFSDFEIYRNNKDSKEALLALVNSSLLAGTGLSSTIAGASQISAFTVGKFKIGNMHRLLGSLRFATRVAGVSTIVLAFAEGGFYAYQWRNGYISTPNFVRKLSVTAATATGAAAGATIGANLGEKIEPTYGQLIGAIGGGIVGGVAAAATASALTDNAYNEIDIKNQNDYLDHFYAYFGQERSPVNRKTGPEI